MLLRHTCINAPRKICFECDPIALLPELGPFMPDRCSISQLPPFPYWAGFRLVAQASLRLTLAQNSQSFLLTLFSGWDDKPESAGVVWIIFFLLKNHICEMFLRVCDAERAWAQGLVHSWQVLYRLSYVRVQHASSMWKGFIQNSFLFWDSVLLCNPGWSWIYHPPVLPPAVGMVDKLCHTWHRYRLNPLQSVLYASVKPVSF